MESFTRGDIVLFPFPFTDLSKSKLRPCLVLSNEMKEDLLLCQITSRNVRKDKFTISLDKNETLNGSLKIDSYVRSNMLFTGSSEKIYSKVCEINKSKYNKVVDKIIEIIRD